MYSVAAYQRMIDDPVRMTAYARALEAAVRPGMVVADLGAGTGILSLLACRFGARRVFAVEPDEALEVARMHARQNGLDDRIEFFPQMSTEVDLPEQADVVVSDMRGVLPPCGSHFAAVIDARKRFLRPGGSLIPEKDELWAAVLEAPQPDEVWDRGPYGLDFSAVDRILANSIARKSQRDVSRERLLTEPERWCKLDYAQLASTECEGTIEARALRGGVAQGVAAWFETVLHGNIGFSTGPGEPDSVYGLLLFPFPKGVVLSAGDRARMRIRAVPSGGDYLWTWSTQVFGEDGAARLELEQSSFYSRPLTPRRLRKRAHDFAPSLNEEGRTQKAILDKLHEGNPLGEIAEQLLKELPGRFETRADAQAAIGDLAEKFCD